MRINNISLPWSQSAYLNELEYMELRGKSSELLVGFVRKEKLKCMT